MDKTQIKEHCSSNRYGRHSRRTPTLVALCDKIFSGHFRISPHLDRPLPLSTCRWLDYFVVSIFFFLFGLGRLFVSSAPWLDMHGKGNFSLEGIRPWESRKTFSPFASPFDSRTFENAPFPSTLPPSRSKVKSQKNNEHQ